METNSLKFRPKKPIKGENYFSLLYVPALEKPRHGLPSYISNIQIELARITGLHGVG